MCVDQVDVENIAVLGFAVEFITVNTVTFIFIGYFFLALGAT